jgi:protein-tyrosine phosphatase
MKKIILIGLLAGIMAFSETGSESRKLTQENNSIVLLNRRKTKVEGLDNIRDIGGYKTKDGKKVKWGILYRADSLSKMTENGKKDFEKLKIGYIFDLRDDNEIAKAPDPVFKNTKYIHTEIPTSGVTAQKPRTTEEIRAFYSKPETLNYWKDGYEYMVGSSKARESIKTILLTSLENKGKTGLIWHCSGGKDRTGFVSVIFLSLLGVDNETILKDYLLTNEYRKKFDTKELEDMKKIFENDPVMTEGFLAIQQAKPEYAAVFMDKIERLYGTTENYLIQEVGITQEQINEIKAIYTE